MTLAETMTRIHSELRTAEAELVKAIDTERSRKRAGLIRALHEVRRMRDPGGYPFSSQAGQDMVVDQIFQGKRDGTFADIGGYDGITGSNTLFFEHWRNWTGVLAEPVAAQRDKAAKLRRCPCLQYAVDSTDGTAEFVEVVKGYTQMSGLAGSYDEALLGQVRADPRHEEIRITVETRTLSRILTEAGIPDPDFVSLDIEGGEVRVLGAFPFDKHAVGVWAIENNTGTPEIGEIMRRNGYALTEFCGPDEIWRNVELFQ